MAETSNEAVTGASSEAFAGWLRHQYARYIVLPRDIC